MATGKRLSKGAVAGGYEDPHHDLLARIEDRRRRRLFLPSMLDDAAKDKRLETKERDAAYEVVKKWWQLAKDGALNRKETSIDDAFLSEVFGQGLGYRGVTEGRAGHERERQFHVPGIGPCDGALGLFPPTEPDKVSVVIELKDAQTHLDRDRFNGRTPVQQLWDYLNAMPESCRWGIVSNFTTIRLYDRASGTQTYEQFTLREMVEDQRAFERFYAIFELYGLVKKTIDEPPRAVRLLESRLQEQRQVGDNLYEYYSTHRLRLIEHLRRDRGVPPESAIRIAQKLIDRVLFIAFCEDRELIRSQTIERACKGVAAFSRDRNPVWQNFLGLFQAMDRGSDTIGVENGYNGGLFRDDDEYPIAKLDLDDVPWANFFRTLGGFDYRDTIDVDVFGHLFEKSVTELERLREGGLFAKDVAPLEAPMMPKSPQRKLFGIFYTPAEFTTAIVEYTVDELVNERWHALRARHGLTEDELARGTKPAAAEAYWRDCLEALKGIKICDPACGSGAFLIRAYEAMFHHYSLAITEMGHLGVRSADGLLDAIPDMILRCNLHGVDLQPEAVEIAQLSLWLRSARAGKTLADLSENIVCGNSLTDDPAVHPRAMRWEAAFPGVFAGEEGGFDCVIGNPPWERLKLQEREFFALSAPQIASAVNAADREAQIAKLEKDNPELYAKYAQAAAQADRMLTYARASGRYPLTGKGDINTYMLFAELAQRIVSPGGRVALLVPSGIATDKTTAEFFGKLMRSGTLKRLYDFENKRGLFADVHRSFKFSILNFGGRQVQSSAADFVFFAHDLRELQDRRRHIALTAADMKLLNPNTHTCPIFRNRRDAGITKAIYRRVPVLIDRNRKEGGNSWGISFARMFDQTNDADLFKGADVLKKDRYRLDDNRWVRGKKTFLPLYEAKMVQAYDHRAASVRVVESNWMRQGQTDEPTLVDRQNPEHVVMPRWWVEEEAVLAAAGSRREYFIGFKDITSATNTRTMIAAAIPWSAATNHFVLMLTEQQLLRECCLLANLNSYAFDFVVRQKIGGVTLNFFIVEQLPTLPPDLYDQRCPWAKRQTLEKWISDRVLKLSCTANDMKPMAQACGMTPPVHKWNPAERAELLAELDAAYFILYGLEREEVLYVLTTFQGTGKKGSRDLFQGQPDGDEAISDVGRQILAAFDSLVSRL